KELLGHAGILMSGPGDELRPSRTGSVFLAYDLERYKSEARAQVQQQSLYWAGWVTALALAMWLVFHFILTRRTARLVAAAEQLAAGNLSARSALSGRDELGRLSRAFDAMALEVAETQNRLRQDIAERVRVQRELEKSEASYRAIFDAAEDAIFVHDIDTGTIVDVNLKPARRSATPARSSVPSTSARLAAASDHIRRMTPRSSSGAPLAGRSS